MEQKTDRRLTGQTAVVTGGGRGIGRAICTRLAQEGADLVIGYGHSEEQAAETAGLCREYGVKAYTVHADISAKASARLLMEEAFARTGRIDILVNNAGTTKDGLSLRMGEAEFDSVLKVNLYGTFFCCQEAERYMLKARYGRIISISSIVGLHGNAGQANYAAAKAGIVGLTKTLAKELASRNITVNAIAPGMIDTRMTQTMTDAAKEAMRKAIPEGHPGKPEDVAEAAVFFALPAAGYITGQILGVDGGMGC